MSLGSRELAPSDIFRYGGVIACLSRPDQKAKAVSFDQKHRPWHLELGTISSEDSMNYRTAVLCVFVGIVIVSFSTGQEKPKSQVASTVKMSDHDKIEKLQLEVAELQKKLAALTEKYETHTHQLALEVAQLPGEIECKQIVVQWDPTGGNRGFVDKVCKQLMYENISVLLRQARILYSPDRPADEGYHQHAAVALMIASLVNKGYQISVTPAKSRSRKLLRTCRPQAVLRGITDEIAVMYK